MPFISKDFESTIRLISVSHALDSSHGKCPRRRVREARNELRERLERSARGIRDNVAKSSPDKGNNGSRCRNWFDSNVNSRGPGMSSQSAKKQSVTGTRKYFEWIPEARLHRGPYGYIDQMPLMHSIYPSNRTPEGQGSRRHPNGIYFEYGAVELQEAEFAATSR